MMKTLKGRISLIIATVILFSTLFSLLIIPSHAKSPELNLSDTSAGIVGSYCSDFTGYSGGAFTGFARHYNWDSSKGQDFSEGRIFSRTKATASSWSDENDINTYARYSRDITISSYKTDYASSPGPQNLTDFWIQAASPEELMASYDFIVIDMDICADQWVLSDGSLSETYEEGALPGYYAGTSLNVCFRYNGIGNWAGDSNSISIKYDSSRKQFYIQAKSDTSIKYYLPNETDVWTHISWVVEVDNSSCSPSASATSTTPGSLLNSKIHIYIDGNYFYTLTGILNKLSSSSTVNVSTDSYGNKVPDVCVETLRMGWTFADSTNKSYSGASRNMNTTSVSYGIDNYAVNYYKNGYTGDLASHPLNTNNNAPLYNCNDVVYSKNYVYSSGNEPVATVTTEGKTESYYFIESAIAAAKDGAILTLYANSTATVNVNKNLTVITNGYSFPFSVGSNIVNYNYDEAQKTYEFRTNFKVFWHLGDEVVSEAYEKGAVPSFKGSYPENVFLNGVSYKTLGGWSSTLDGTSTATFSALNADAHFYIRRSTATYYTITGSDGTLKKTEIESAASIVDAVKNASDGDRFTLVSDIILNTNIIMPIGKTVYFDLAGRSLTFTATGEHIYNEDGSAKKWDGGKEASFNLSNNSTLYLYSSAPGAIIYNSYYNYLTELINGQAIVNCLYNVTGSKLYMGEVSVDGKTYSGDNITTYSANLLYHQGNSTNTATVKGGKYYRVLSDNRAMIVSNNGAVIKISDALIASKAGAIVSTYKSGDAASLTNITFEGCTVYTTGALLSEFNTGATVRLNRCYVISNIAPGASAGSVILGEGTYICSSSTLDSYVSYNGTSAKTRNTLDLSLEFITFAYNKNTEDPTLATYNQASSEIVTVSNLSFSFNKVISAPSDYQTVKWIYNGSTITERWYKGNIPESPVSIAAATNTYKFVLSTEIVEAVGGTVKTYEYVQKIAYPIYSSVSLSSSFIYNVYIPKNMSSYVNGVYYGSEKLPLSAVTVIDGAEYYTVKIPITAANAAKADSIRINAKGYQNISFNDTYEVSIPAYAEKILNGSYDESTKSLVRATTAYIKAAGDFFGTDTSNIGSVTNAAAVEGVIPDAVPDAIKNVFSGVQFALEGQISLRLNLRDEVDSLTVKLAYIKSGSRVLETITEEDFKDGSKCRYYDLPLRAADLLEGITITIGDASYTYSLDNYIYKISKTNLAESTPTLMTLLYNLRAYGAIAKEYVNEPPIIDMFIAGNDIGEYEIVANTEAELNAAAIIKNQIYLKTRYSLNIVSSTLGPAIRLNLSGYSSTNDFIVTVSGQDLVINCAYGSFFENAVIEFSNEYIAVAENNYNFTSGFSATYTAEYVSYTDFGAVGDGVTDDFAAMKRAHDKANSKGYIVKVNDGTYYVGNTNGAYITVKTNVIWTGATIIIDDTKVAWSSSSRNVDIFKFVSEYSSKTYASGSAVVNAFNNSGLTSNTTKVDYEPGYKAMIVPYDDNHKVYIRYGANANSGQSQAEVVVIDEEGYIDPETKILLDYDTITKVVEYRVDDEPLTAKGGKFITIANQAPRMYTYYRRGFAIQRSNLTIEGLEHKIQGESHDYGAPYSGFFTLERCNNFLAKDCILQSHLTHVDDQGKEYGQQQNNTTMGSYDIGGSFFNHAEFVNCVESNFYQDSSKTTVRSTSEYWGIMGTNYCKNIIYKDSILSRLDAHAGVYNVTVSGCKIIWINLIGGGTANITDTTVYQNTVVYLRSDYGSTWHGDINIKNVHVMNTGNVTLVGGSWSNHYFGYQTYLPTNINVENVTLKTKRSVYVISSYASSDVRNHATNPLIITKNITIKNNSQKLTYYTSSSAWLSNSIPVT